MGMILVKMSNSGEMEPEETKNHLHSIDIMPSCCMGPPTIFKIFVPELFLSKRNAEIKMEQRLKGKPSSDWHNLGSILCTGTKP